MIDDMGIFRTTVAVAHLARPNDQRSLDNVMVDTGSEYTWIPRSVLEDLGVERQRVDRFETADGRVLERDVAFAMLYAGGRSAASAVVFAERDDLALLGAHGLEGMNLRVDLLRKELVPAGPVPAALGCAGDTPNLRRDFRQIVGCTPSEFAAREGPITDAFIAS